MNERREQARKLKREGLSYSQIGEKMGVTKQRAQQLVTIPKSELEKLRIAANGKCQKCGKPSNKLDGHHEDYNSDRLIMVCVSCHMHKGHTARLTGRLTTDYMRRLTTLRKRRGESEAVCIEWLIELGEKEMRE